MADQADYVAMQRAFYDDPKADPNAVVGNYAFHENFPYETHFLYEYGDLRKPLFADVQDRMAFDIGCGEGRMIRRMSRIFKRCDGADISQNMTTAARARCPDSTIWLTRGHDCGDAPSNTYDFVYCTVSLQHIASYDIRSSIIKDITRILKPGGKMTLQMLYSEVFPFTRTGMRGTASNGGIQPDLVTEILFPNRKDVGWFDNNFAAKSTNSHCDTVFGEADIPAVIKDLGRFFSYASIWFHDISIGRVNAQGVSQLPDTHPNCHLHIAYPGTHFAFIHGANPLKT